MGKRWLVVIVVSLELGCAFSLVTKNKRIDETEIVRGRVIEIVKEIKEKANIKDTIRVYTHSPTNSYFEYSESGDGIFRHKSGDVRIYTRKEILDYFTSRALRGYLAHEIGHLVAGHVDQEERWPELSYSKRQQRQKEADSFVRLIYDQETLDAYLKDYAAVAQHGKRE